MVLATLARHGPRHGHEIRRLAEVTNVGEWGGVSVGALYRELRAMEGEGLVDPVRTEQVGRRPARTVYAITREGWVEFAMLRERAVRSVRWGPDELGVALTFAGPGPDRDELISWLNARREVMAASAAMLETERNRLTTKGYLDPFAAAAMYRSQLHAETEVRWHDEFAKILAELPEEAVEWTEVPSGFDFRAQVTGPAHTKGALRATDSEPGPAPGPAPGH
jgi:DNA-binding PadR family transcriptional regulator